MITLDSIKIQAPVDVLKDINTSAIWHENTSTVSGDKTKDTSHHISSHVGLKSILIDKLKDTVTIELSAKILKDNYFSLINLNTYDQAMDEINKAGIINIDKDLMFNFGTFLTADFCNNLKVSEPVNSYFPQLLGINSNTRYKVERYNKKDNQGVTINGSQTSFKERQIFYNKMLDLNKDRDLLKVVNYNDLNEQFIDVLRVEMNAVQLKIIRDYTNTKELTIGNVLTSAAKPNYKLFNKVTSKYIDYSLFNEHPDLKLYEIEKLEGRKAIIERLGYDPVAINEFLSQRLNGNPSRYKKEYGSLRLQLLAEKNLITEPHSNNHINEILKLLSAA